jgi:hypothetical protein
LIATISHSRVFSWLRVNVGRKRRLLALGGVMVLSAGLASAEQKPELKNLVAGRLDVAVTRIENFSRIGGAAAQFGKLEWRGGLQLSSNHPNFGGWSGLSLDADGRHFIAVSDGGAWMTGEMSFDGAKLSGLENARIGPLLTTEGQPLKRNRDRDAEAVAIVSGGTSKGSLLVSFEQNARIARYDVSDAGVSPARGFIALPAESRKMRRNKGLEAMTVLKGGPYKGSVIAMSERLHDSAGNHTGWIWIGGKAQRFNLTNIGDYDVTDVASADDGSIVILERRFRWLEGMHMRIRRVPAAVLKAGATLSGDVLLEANLEQEIDNMEGLAVSRGRGGETLLTLISDNNFNTVIQRTIVLQFALAEPKTAKARP